MEKGEWKEMIKEERDEEEKRRQHAEKVRFEMEIKE